MNIKKVINYIGTLIELEGILFIFPFCVSLFYHESIGKYFFIMACLLVTFGIILRKFFIGDMNFYSAEGFVTVSIGWIVLSIFGCIPFLLSGEIANPIDALFETVSGFTTTGATIICDVSKISHSLNFWRCFTHFVGGMGILVLMVALLPTKSENMHILKAESPGPQVGKLLPKVSDTAKILYIIYIFMTALAIILYIISGMPVFDSICIGLGTAGTGGFVVTKNGCSDYNVFSQSLIAIFMFLFGVNFNLYYLLILKKVKLFFKSEEFRVYLGIVIAAISIITINTFTNLDIILKTVHDASFQVVSIMTTTGFSTYDYTNWPILSRYLLLVLMVIGGCAGSTAGGFKVSRIIICVKVAMNELYLQLHPNSVKVIKFEDKAVSYETIRTLLSYLIIYVSIIIVGIFLISFENFDMETTLSSVFETFNNIGLGLGKIGPTGNFSIFSDFSKIVFIILMLTGRLEIFPMIILLSLKTWRRER